MKMFNLFKKKKKMTLKELYAPVLDEMWVCVVNFCPWEPEKHDVVFKKVNIVSACANDRGIFVESDETDPFSYGKDKLNGYIDKITDRWHWTGFFETEQSAKAAYNDLMLKWCDVIKSKLVNI